MKRREALYQVGGLVGSGVLVGCLGGDSTTDETTSGGRTAPTQPTTTTRPTATTQSPPAIESRAIKTTSTDCLQDTQSPTANQSATIEFDSGMLLVTGVIKSPDPCHEATIESMPYDTSADALTLVVGVAEETSEMCI